MPQLILPIFPTGSTHITNELTFEQRDGRVTYFHGMMPVFSHDANDIKSFRMITAQFCINGNAKQIEITRAFGVPSNSVKRAVKLYQEKGASGFFAARKTRGAAVLTPLVLSELQTMLDEGLDTKEISSRLGIKRDTLRKAILAGRLHRPSAKKNSKSM